MTSVRQHWDILLFLLVSTLFVAEPQIDLAVSSWFYRTDGGFFLRDESWVLFIHNAIPLVARCLGAALAVILILGLIPRCKRFAEVRLPVLFLLLSFAFGPGLLVNAVLKEHWGRARPADVHEFGGARTFSPAFIIADQCKRNCSFVSGHAAQGYYFSLIGFLVRRWVWFMPGLALGSFVGLARIAQGRHFLSDVLISLFAVYFVGKMLRNLLFSPAAAARLDDRSTPPMRSGFASCIVRNGRLPRYRTDT